MKKKDLEKEIRELKEYSVTNRIILCGILETYVKNPIKIKHYIRKCEKQAKALVYISECETLHKLAETVKSIDKEEK